MNKASLVLRSKLMMFVLIAFLIIACNPNKATANQINTRDLVFPNHANYYSLVNIKGSPAVLVLDKSTANLSAYAKEGSQDFVKFSLPDDPNCFRTVYDAYETLPDGQLQLWKRCESGGNGTKIYLMTYEWATGQLKKLAGPLPLGSSGASWNLSQTKAIGYLDSGFASKTLFWLSDGDFGPLDLVIGDKNQSWNLKDDFPDFKSTDTGTTGRAAWSPNGNWIVFFASPDAMGKTSFDRFSANYNLYLMDPETLTPKVVLDTIYSPYVLAWSPNSKNVAFVGDYGLLKQEGIWIYSLDTGVITQVSLGIYNSIL